MLKSKVVVFTVYRRLFLEILYSLQQCEFVINISIVYVCSCYYAQACVCVCVCVCERERERDISHTHRNRDRENRKYFKAVFAQTQHMLSILSIIQTAFYVLETMAQNE